jgi:acylaminoacyl-peptidase
MDKTQPSKVAQLVDEFRTLYLKNASVTNLDCSRTDSGAYCIEVALGYADPQDEMGLKTTYSQIFDPKTKEVHHINSMVSEDVTVFNQKYSPSSNYKAVLKGSKAGMIIELYGREGLVLRQLVPPTVHMAAIRKAPAFVTDPIVWSQDETRFMYVADDPKPLQNLFKLKEVGIFRYRYEDIPGERIQGHTNPSIFIYDIPTRKLFQVAKPDETLYSRKVWVMPQFADKQGHSILCVQIEMCGVYEMAFFNNYPKRLAYLKGLETEKTTKGGLLNILRVVPEEVSLPKVPGSTEEIVYFPRVSPDWTKFSYLYAEKAYMGNTNTFGFRVMSLLDLTNPPETITTMCREENGEYHGIQGFNHTLHAYSWLGNETILATTFFYNTTEIFEINIVTKKVTRVTQKKKYLECEAQYVVGAIDADHLLIRRDCIYRNNLFHVLYKDEAGEYQEVPLYKEFNPGYKVWEKKLEHNGISATFYGKEDASLPNEERGLIVWIHGGPHANWVNVYHPFHQYFIQRGQNVLNVNFTGSTGRGEAFCEKLHSHTGFMDADEIKNFILHMLETKQVHPDKVRYFSGSHGGGIGIRILQSTPNLIKSMSIFNPPTDGNTLHPEATFPGTFRAVTLGKHRQVVNEAVDTTEEECLAAKPGSLYQGFCTHSTQVLLFGGMKDCMVTPGSNRKLYKMARDWGNNWELFEYPDEEHMFLSPNSCFDYFVKSALLFEDKWVFN